MSKPSKRAGAPDWKQLLEDDAAIRRMTDRLMRSYLPEIGGIPLGTLEEAREFVISLVQAATI